MSKLTELLDELCPEGVEFRTLKEVCKEIIVPQRDRPKVFGGEIPWCRIEDIEGQLITGSKLGLGVTKDTIEGMNLRVCPEGTVLATCSASLGVVAIAAQPLVTNQTFIGLVCGEDLLNKYLYYFLFTQERKMKSIASTGTIPYISRKKFERLCVPVPPLEVQQEIVRVLDAFTDLEQSLVSELELRKKQFDVYRGKLFNLGDFVEWSTLGEVSAKVVSGGTPDSRNPSYYGGDIPWLRTQEINFKDIHETEMYITEEGLNNSSAKWIPANCVIVAMYGATAAKSAVNIIPLTTNQACCNLEINPSLAEYRFVFHWVSHMYENLKSLGEGSQSNINSKKVKSFRIPLPPLETQREILTKLDTFKSLIQSIEQEITLRRRQYEFYRDELLSFTPKED